MGIDSVMTVSFITWKDVLFNINTEYFVTVNK